MTNEALNHAIVGQNEPTVRDRLGTPARTVQLTDGRKMLIYEYRSKGMFEEPYKSRLTFSYSGDIVDQEPHLNWQYSTINTETNAPEYTTYQKKISVLEVILNDDGRCEGFQQNLTKQQLKQFYNNYKKYITEEK